MKIIMVAAISKDEFITKGDNPDVTEWTSIEDKEFFNKIKSEHKLFVMGSKTFDSGAVMPKSGTLKIVLATNPERYSDKEITGQLEFRNLNPKDFVAFYESSYNICLLLGGGYTYSQFLESNLVDEMFITIEPIEHKSGTPLLANGKKLIDFTKNIEPTLTELNSSGSLLLHYVLK